MANAAIFAPAIATSIDMPPFFLDHLKLVKMPAYKESKIAPIAEGYPVILFSHGWNGFNAQNTGQAIQLASHGYVVVGVQHTYGAVVTVFSNGTIAHNNPSALPNGAPDDEYEAAAQKLVRQWAGDLGYALYFLEEQTNDPPSSFYQSLDLSRVGVYGHSTGGGAAIQFCGTDARCDALLGMDPFMRPVSVELLENGVSQPAFFMFSQRWADDVDSRNSILFHRFTSNATNTLGMISIDGTAHYDFSDLPLLSPLAPRLGLKGPISGLRVTTIIYDYLLSFFDRTLKGVPTDLFESQNRKYNEVNLTSNLLSVWRLYLQDLVRKSIRHRHLHLPHTCPGRKCRGVQVEHREKESFSKVSVGSVAKHRVTYARGQQEKKNGKETRFGSKSGTGFCWECTR
jgi:pimeloyl-ACP methyl ester carboxylesterase